MFSRIFKKVPDGLLSLALGLSMPLAFAPYNAYLVAILSPALLVKLSIQNSGRNAFKNGYLFGLGMFGTGVLWLHISISTFGGMNLITSLILTYILVLYLALYPALTLFIARKYFYKSDFHLLLIAIPCLWTISEWLRSWIFTGFPWLNLGYSQADSLLAGVAIPMGVYGVSLFVMVSAGLLVLIIDSTDMKRFIYGAVLIFIWYLSGLSLDYPWTTTSRGGVNVALIQGAIPQAEKWRPENRQNSLDLYLSLSEPHWQKDMVIWPETAIPAFPHHVPDFIESLKNKTIAGKAIFLTGLPVKDLNTNQYFNSVMLIENDKSSLYHKQHLVPFGEYLPLKFILGGLVNILNIPMSDFTPGDKHIPILNSNEYSIGVSICYEDTFGEEVAKALPEADVLVNVSNDAWFGDSLAPHQHLQMARMRALETGRFLLRSTNTGISAIIDEKGVIINRSPQFTPAALTSVISLYNGSTPYTRFGNLPIIIICFLALILLRSNSIKRNLQ